MKAAHPDVPIVTAALDRGSTTRATSSPASATPATGCSGRSANVTSAAGGTVVLAQLERCARPEPKEAPLPAHFWRAAHPCRGLITLRSARARRIPVATPFSQPLLLLDLPQDRRRRRLRRSTSGAPQTRQRLKVEVEGGASISAATTPSSTTRAAPSAPASASSAAAAARRSGSGTRAGRSSSTRTPRRSTRPCRCRPSAPTSCSAARPPGSSPASVRRTRPSTAIPRKAWPPGTSGSASKADAPRWTSGGKCRTRRKNAGEMRVMGRLNGKRCLVTAAGAGIGRATALALAAEGARVLATDVNAELLAELPKTSGLAAERLDVLDRDAVARAGRAADRRRRALQLRRLRRARHHPRHRREGLGLLVRPQRHRHVPHHPRLPARRCWSRAAGRSSTSPRSPPRSSACRTAAPTARPRRR